MSKSSVLIASVLKPVDDTRMYEKFAFSIARTGEVEVHVLGFKPGGPMPDTAPYIHLYPLFSFSRLSWKRLLAPWKFLSLVLKVKPELIIVNTHELLIVSILNQILFGGRLVYDIQENYFRNILFTDSFPLVFKPLLAAWVRSKEIITRPWIHHYFLAEIYYEKEFWFSRGKSTVIQNKYQPTGAMHQRSTTGKSKYLLFSGTIARSTGIFESIRLAEVLHQIDQDVKLSIIGYCAKTSTLQKIRAAIADRPYIRLTGGETLVPHQQVLDEIDKADFGLMCYPVNKSTKNTIPTKLFEYIGHRLPVLLHDYEPWRKMCENYKAAIVVDYYKFDPSALLKEMQATEFYPKNLDYREVYWETEASKLVVQVRELLNLSHCKT